MTITDPLLSEFCGFDPDTRLMLAAKRGETAGLALLAERHWGNVKRFLYRRLRDLSVAEDLTQEVFLRVHRTRLTYEPTAKFTTWLYRIAGNLALNWERDHRRERFFVQLDAPLAPGAMPQFADRGIRADDWMSFQATRDEVRRAVAELPGRQREVVLLHKFDEMDGHQIAAMMGCSHQAVRSLLCRAYANLRVRLGHLGADS